jgi:hypothetical protein
MLCALAMTASSPGAILLAGAIVASLVRRDTRTVATLAVPALAYAAWFVGTSSMGPSGPRADAAGVIQAPLYIVEGLARTAGAAIGILGSVPGWIALGVLVGLAIVAARRGWRPSPTLVGLAAATASLFASVAVLRGYLRVEGVASSRYLYVAAPLVGVLVAEIGPVLVPAMASARPRSRFAIVAVSVLVLDLALVGNVRLLADARAWQFRSAREVRAALDMLAGPDAAACDIDAVETRPEEVVVATMPTPSDVRRFLDRFGDPRTDILVPWAVIPPTDEDHALARRLLCRS